MIRTVHVSIFGASLAVLALAGSATATSPPTTTPIATSTSTAAAATSSTMLAATSSTTGTLAVTSTSAPSGPVPIGPLCAAVPAEGQGSAASMATQPVAAAAATNPLLGTLSQAITAAGLTDTLNGPGEFTVFAPIDSAFDKLDRDTFDSLMADPAALGAILTYHVVPQRLSSADLFVGGTFSTAHGANLTVEQVNETLVLNFGAAAVQCAGIETANATVFLIDTVLVPPADEEPVATTDAPETTIPDVETTDVATTAADTTPVETTLPVETSEPAPVTTEAVVTTTIEDATATTVAA
jgi:uncharacterized surface protein with fasciclin (FAS1) repeats